MFLSFQEDRNHILQNYINIDGLKIDFLTLFWYIKKIRKCIADFYVSKKFKSWFWTVRLKSIVTSLHRRRFFSFFLQYGKRLSLRVSLAPLFLNALTLSSESQQATSLRAVRSWPFEQQGSSDARVLCLFCLQIYAEYD